MLSTPMSMRCYGAIWVRCSVYLSAVKTPVFNFSPNALSKAAYNISVIS